MSSSPRDPEVEFPKFGDAVFVRVDGYFTSGKAKIPFKSSDDKPTHLYYVEHVVDSRGILDPRTYYRKISSKSGTEFHAIFTSNNVVKKVKIKD